MIWHVSHRADWRALLIADRHYNRQKPGTPQFVPPGRCLVFLTQCQRALWVTSWPYAEYVKHVWAGAWVNSCFRNEGAGLSSDLIRQAVAATLSYWNPPELTKRKAIEAAMARLRSEAISRAVRDEHGKLISEGSPLPGTVEKEIGGAYEAGRIAGLRGSGKFGQ